MSTTSAGQTYRRTDQLGGVKGSGMGCEGPRHSIRDMTEDRMPLFNYAACHAGGCVDGRPGQ